MKEHTESVVVLVTCGSAEEADSLAEALVNERLAACVNVGGPIRSIYRWEDAVQRDAEWLMVIKTREALFSPLEARIRELHSYDTPEVVALPIVAGSAAYLAWLSQATSAA
jgi:periplasmic divalent cation tolerance protein